jgi:hypothetical protein
MYSSSLEGWYDKGISFSLTCQCGNNIEGVFFKGDNVERLHCSKCNLVWDIKKHWKEEE